MCKNNRLTISQTKGLVLSLALVLSLLCCQSANAQCSVQWFAEDTNTQGDWFNNPVGSPIGVYGCYAYILPGGEEYEAVIGVPVADFSVPDDFNLLDPSTWSLLSQFGWTNTQINGLVHIYNDPCVQTPPYLDEYCSQSPEVTYHAKGTEFCLPAPRELLNIEGDTTYDRATCWFAGSSNFPGPITLTLDLNPGTYLLSLYILDYDGNARRQTIEVSTDPPSDSNTVNVDWAFDDGRYENFFVHLATDANVVVTITKTAGANAVLSGVFLSSTSETPTDPLQNEIRWVSEDSATHGDWMETYGDLGYIKCGWDLPQTAPGPAHLTWSDANDHNSPAITYSAITALYPWTNTSSWLECIQYPVFEWQWHDGFHSSQTEPREVYYPLGDGDGNHWRLACWDDGGERCQPTNGYMDFHLTFPDGMYLLSLYAYDYERTSRQSQKYEIYDETGTILLASRQISDPCDFDEGIYEIFKVEAPPEGCNLIARVYNDAGHPTPNINVLLSGIFVDRVETVCGKTIGFWKTNAAKILDILNGKPQITRTRYLRLLNCVVDRYAPRINDWYNNAVRLGDWRIEAPYNNYDINWAYIWLSYGKTQPALKANDAKVKARAQLLALMLTACHKGSDYTDAWFSVPGYGGPMPISDWIRQVIRRYNAGQYKAVYKIAVYLNQNCGLLPLNDCCHINDLVD